MASDVSPRRPSPQILVVDDDPSTTDSYARMLRLEGFSVETALDARTALQQVQQRCPDAIIVDLRLPTVDGLMFVKILKERPAWAHIRCAMVTGDYTVEDHVLADIRALGIPLVLKPLWFEDLVALANTLTA